MTTRWIRRAVTPVFDPQGENTSSDTSLAKPLRFHLVRWVKLTDEEIMEESKTSVPTPLPVPTNSQTPLSKSDSPTDVLALDQAVVTVKQEEEDRDEEDHVLDGETAMEMDATIVQKDDHFVQISEEKENLKVQDSINVLPLPEPVVEHQDPTIEQESAEVTAINQHLPLVEEANPRIAAQQVAGAFKPVSDTHMADTEEDRDIRGGGGGVSGSAVAGSEEVEPGQNRIEEGGEMMDSESGAPPTVYGQGHM